MRNDTLDELDDIPSLTTDSRDREVLGREPIEQERFERAPRAARSRRGIGSGFLWILVLALVIALGALGWWSYQQIGLMEQQLVATQENFARISEEAAGRIKDINGKMVAAESTVSTGSEALKLQVRQLSDQLADLVKQQQGLTAQQGDLGKRLDQIATDLQAQKSAGVGIDGRLKSMSDDMDRLRAQQLELNKLNGRMDDLDADIAALKKQGNPSQAIKELQQDLLVLRSQLDDAPAPASNGPSTAEFDAYRAQVTRNINSLQSQVQSLQQQINAR